MKVILFLKKLLLSFIFLLGSAVYAQEVTGTVSEGSESLPGVSVQVKGSTVGTETDFDGKWSYSDIVSVSLQSSFGDVAVLPNPVKGNSILSFGSAKAVSVKVSIKDITGKTILEKNHISSPGKNTVNLDTENFNHGMYFLILNNGTELNTIKFIVE